MTDKHTPGPWRQVRHTVWAGPPNTANGPIAETSGCTFDEGEANARLIAAAPTLLEALEDVIDSNFQHGMVKVTPEMFAIITQARDAIKAAKGDA